MRSSWLAILLAVLFAAAAPAYATCNAGSFNSNETGSLWLSNVSASRSSSGNSRRRYNSFLVTFCSASDAKRVGQLAERNHVFRTIQLVHGRSYYTLSDATVSSERGSREFKITFEKVSESRQ
jgi:hypothetical protein